MRCSSDRGDDSFAIHLADLRAVGHVERPVGRDCNRERMVESGVDRRPAVSGVTAARVAGHGGDGETARLIGIATALLPIGVIDRRPLPVVKPLRTDTPTAEERGRRGVDMTEVQG